MLTKISDNPAESTGIIGTFVAALMGVLVTFGVPLTQPQMTAILVFVAALYAVLTWINHVLTVPKTPSSTAPATLQVPPPGTVLVTTAAAAAKAPVPAGSVIATAAPATP